MPFVVSVSEPIERWEALSIRVCQTDFWDRWSDRRFTFHCLQMCKYGFVSIVPLIVIRSQFWILETAASFCQIEVPSHRFLIIIGALDTNITYKDKLALALRQSLWRKANTRKFSFEIPLRWPMHIINPVDKTKIILLYSLTDTAPLFLKNLPHLIKYMFKGNKHGCIEAATK